jgi:hypothetical protein
MTRAIRRATPTWCRSCRAIQATNADLVFACAYPPDTVGIVRAANEIGLTPKMFGGAMIGLLATPIKMQLGPLVNGLTIMESFIPAPTLDRGSGDAGKPGQAPERKSIRSYGFRRSPMRPARCCTAVEDET